jgi:hypothetical protein
LRQHLTITQTTNFKNHIIYNIKLLGHSRVLGFFYFKLVCAPCIMHKCVISNNRWSPPLAPILRIPAPVFYHVELSLARSFFVRALFPLARAGPPRPTASPTNILSPLVRGRISLPIYCSSVFRGRNFCIGWRDGFILTVIPPLFLLFVRRLHSFGFKAGFTNMRICFHSSFTIYNSPGRSAAKDPSNN